MPSEYNELLAILMEARPEFATDLYESTEGPALPDYDSITIDRQTLSVPSQPDRLRVCALAVYSKSDKQEFAVLFDTLLEPDPAQAEFWLALIVETQRALSCMVAFVVLCRDARTAKWALTYSTVGDVGNYVLPVVIPSLLARA
ncbi:hypothetical protein [Glycomyces salinus]|uniref:hypothetical protein n=1 Tax=Glycomyces salinus TaxID=980294 RepID=UPI0018ECF884|nr:hypothetical protein [Glycomyces salinus]